MFGVLIMIATCWAIIKGVSRKVLAIIVILDLSFLSVNYLVLFMDYDVVSNFLGEGVVDVVTKISLFLGLILD